MKTVSIRRKILFLLLVMVVATPWASVAGSEREGPWTIQGVELGVPEIFSRIWSFLGRVGSKVGCNIDPLGRCVPKEGCNIDPNGNCLPPSQPKAGCRIDPWGHCLPEPKIGCHIDPNGRCLP